MRVRSTGLGKTEMVCVLKEIAQHNVDGFVMHVDSTVPAAWHIQIVLEPTDVPKALIQLLRPTNIFGVVKLLCGTLVYLVKCPFQRNNPEKTGK
jgi:hypothetical protein